jgi:hypothetical protein
MSHFEAACEAVGFRILHFIVFFNRENTPVKRKRRFNWAGEMPNAQRRRLRDVCAA